MKGFTGELKKRIKNKETLLFGCIMDSHSGAVVEMYHETGFDAIMIDREHTALNSETIREHIRLARALEIPCMVRAADHSYHEVCRFLLWLTRPERSSDTRNNVTVSRFLPMKNSPIIVRLNARTMPMNDLAREILAPLSPRLIEIEGGCDAEILDAGREADAILADPAYRRRVGGGLPRLPAPFRPGRRRCPVRPLAGAPRQSGRDPMVHSHGYNRNSSSRRLSR